MKQPTRKQLKEAIQKKDIGAVLHIPKGTLTTKQKKFAQAIAIDGMTGADAYRTAYKAGGKPKTIGDAASRLKADSRIQAEITALEHAQAVSALHSAEALRSLVISSLTSALIDPDVKAATKIQAAKVLGTVTEVAAFTERKQITTINDSVQIRERILQELKTIALRSDDVQEVDAHALLDELTGGGVDESAQADPTGGAPPQAGQWDSGSDIHSSSHQQSPQISETTPISSNTPTPRGDILEENDDAAPQ
jgi:hypothetical protein